VRLEKCRPEEAGFTEPKLAPLPPPPGLPPAPRQLDYGAQFRRGREAGR
jgi:sulfite dehydrogenase (quinone) subunit SoeA